MTSDERRRDDHPVVNPVPEFSQPPTPPCSQPPTPDQDPTPPPVPLESLPTAPGHPSLARRLGLGGRNTTGRDTPTDTSSPASGEPARLDPVTAGKLVVGLLGIVVGVAAWGLMRRGRELRMPEERDLTGMGEPVGRILQRRLPIAGGQDLADVVEFGSAFGVYLTRGPLTYRAYPDPNLPNVDETQEH